VQRSALMPDAVTPATAVVDVAAAVVVVGAAAVVVLDLLLPHAATTATNALTATVARVRCR
jgi:hypothetical protein